MSDPPEDPKAQPFGSGSLAPEALAGLGKLRECVAAARNLEHLIGSLDVGPKVLQQVVPEVAAELEPLPQTVEDIYSFVQGQLALPEDSLASLFGAARETSDHLLASLQAETKNQFNARQRLALERSLRKSLPPLRATLCQFELLIEATSFTPVLMSVGELLASAPDAGSNRPRRTILFTGDVDEMMVSVPARIAIGCLSMVAAGLEESGRPWKVLQAHRNEGRIQMLYGAPTGDEVRQAEIPICPYATYSLQAVAAALGRFDGRLERDGSGISLPEH